MIVKYLVSVFLSFLIVFAQLGLVQTTHICGGTPVLSKLGIGLADLTCGPELQNGIQKESECENKNHAISKKPCCKNTSVTLQLDDKFQKKNFSEIQFLAFSVTFILHKSVKNQYVNSSFYKKIGFIQTKDIPIWNQSFLI